MIRLGRCHPCGIGFSWSKNVAALWEMFCPRCGSKLARTNASAYIPFVELTNEEAHRASSQPIQDPKDL